MDDEHLVAVTAAGKVGLPAERGLKTPLVRGDRNGYAFAVVPGDIELDFRALAKLSGNRKVEVAPLKGVPGVCRFHNRPMGGDFDIGWTTGNATGEQWGKSRGANR